MKKYAVAFPGQGSQYISMGKNMYMHNKIVRDLFDEASTILGYDLAKLCFEGDIEELQKQIWFNLRYLRQVYQDFMFL